jgi:hypothetical protein
MNKLKVVLFALILGLLPRLAGAAWITTDTINGGGSMSSPPLFFCGENAKIHFHSADSNSVKIELVDENNAPVRVLADRRREFSLTVSVKEKGTYHLAITALSKSWKIEIEQDMDEVQLWKLRKTQPEMITPLSKIATWTGGTEEVTYEINVTESTWKLQWTYGGGEACSLRVTDEHGQEVTGFAGNVDSPASFWFYRPGKYKVTVKVPDGRWILHAAVLKKDKEPRQETP